MCNRRLCNGYRDVSRRAPLACVCRCLPDATAPQVPIYYVVHRPRGTSAHVVQTITLAAILCSDSPPFAGSATACGGHDRECRVLGLENETNRTPGPSSPDRHHTVTTHTPRYINTRIPPPRQLPTCKFHDNGHPLTLPVHGLLSPCRVTAYRTRHRCVINQQRISIWV